MFNDRDLYILGGGGFLAILCLLPSWPFWLKITLALVIMVAALVVALLRVGADRRTLEQQFYYFLRYRFQPKRYQYYGRGEITPGTDGGQQEGAHTPTLSLAWDDMNVYVLMTVWLAVIGVYFTVWLKDSGEGQLAVWLQHISNLR
jgi:hypothetical protein